MYAILVNEPGAETSLYVMPTAGGTLDTTMKLMSEAAEEWISEQLELNGGAAEDYTIVTDVPGSVQIVSSQRQSAEPALISFEAAVIAKVV